MWLEYRKTIKIKHKLEWCIKNKCSPKTALKFLNKSKTLS